MSLLKNSRLQGNGKLASHQTTLIIINTLLSVISQELNDLKCCIIVIHETIALLRILAWKSEQK